MNIQAIYHKGDSEDAYIFPETVCNIRIKTGKEIKKVTLLFGEPFDYQADDKGNWSWIYEKGEMKKISESKLFAYWSVTVKSDTKRLQYGFLVHEDEDANFDKLPDEKLLKNEIPDSEESSIFYGINGPLKISKRLLTSGSQFFKMPYFQEADMVNSPEWTYCTKWYQVIVDRFYKAGGPWRDNAGGNEPYKFFGGNLKGLQEKLPYIKSLGFNGLYMCPIFTSPSIHKYNTENYFEVDPQYGTKDDLKNLIDAAHKMGMRVMLDGVFNHVGTTSEIWEDILLNQQKSKYADWFYIKSWPIKKYNAETDWVVPDVEYESFAFSSQMPKWNTNNPAVQDYLISVGEYWAKEFNIDGWRLDVADEVDHAFWRKFRSAVRRVNPYLYFVGECQLNAQSFLEGDEFDAVMNYKMTRIINDGLLYEKISIEDMCSLITDHLMIYRHQTNASQMNMLDSHDTERILTSARGDKKKVIRALSLLYALPGAPCIYYGTEVGMVGLTDPDCRRTMIWNEADHDLELKDRIKRMNAHRLENWEILAFGDVTFRIEKNRLTVYRTYGGKVYSKEIDLK